MNQQENRDHLIIGLTGSIGSGKSTVADIFEEEGIPVLRADRIAKELMTDDPELRREIIDAFGKQAYNNGELDRAYLASQIFNDRKKLETMNALVHPRTIAAQGVRARRLFDEGYPIVACEAALIYESGGEGRFDYIVVVDARDELRFQRAARRDGASAEDVARRDAAQMPARQKCDLADFVIRNDGTEEELRRNTEFIIRLLRALPPRERLEVDDEDSPEEDQ